MSRQVSNAATALSALIAMGAGDVLTAKTHPANRRFRPKGRAAGSRIADGPVTRRYRILLAEGSEQPFAILEGEEYPFPHTPLGRAQAPTAMRALAQYRRWEEEGEYGVKLRIPAETVTVPQDRGSKEP